MRALSSLPILIACFFSNFHICKALVSRSTILRKEINFRKNPSGVSLMLDAKDQDNECHSQHRRSLLTSIPLILLLPTDARARGLVKFPIETPLLNTYHLMRVGTTLLEDEDIWSTNPLFLTNRDDKLSEKGQEQVVDASQKINTEFPTVVKYSLAASCIDTADTIARELRISRDRLVPEFTFMDPRAIGQWDMMNKTETQPAVWAMDVDEAGADGVGGRPPPNDDGTPHETLADQAVRLRQVMSVLESQYSGDTILLIFPDGTSPALLSAMMAGIPYNRVHELEFAPGEIRVDVNKDSVLKLWQTRQENKADYEKIIAKGRVKLKEIRSQKTFVNIKDKKLEQERIRIDEEQQKRDEKRRSAEAEDRAQRMKRQEEIAEREGGPSDSAASLLIAAPLALLGGLVPLFQGSRKNETMTMNSTETSTTSFKTSAIGSSNRTSDDELTRNMILDRNTSLNSPQRVNGDSAPTIGAVSEVNRYKVAETAMEEYMDQGDGGDAWLQSISDILNESEEDDSQSSK